MEFGPWIAKQSQINLHFIENMWEYSAPLLFAHALAAIAILIDGCEPDKVASLIYS